MSEKKYIIIGWGLAGSTLAWQFYLEGVPCTVYDSRENHCSRVAAGMINPIVFKRLTKGWKVDILMPYAKGFYSKVEETLGVSLLSNKKIVRVFSSVEEQNNWASLEGDGRFDAYLNPVDDLDHPHVNAPFGVGKVNSLGNLDINLYLDKSKEFLSENGVEFINRPFMSKMLDRDEYIYCQGYKLTMNPFFQHLKLKLAHGDVLTIKAPDLKYDDILNKNMFVLPLGDDLYRIGSTYNWEMTEPVPTEAGKNELLERLRSFCSFDFEIVSHEGGIRPTVQDRRPLLGTHPVRKGMHVFNGLGTKGVSIAPYYANMMFNYLVNNKDLDPEVDINRFKKHFMRNFV
ncbi:MAG: FAD-binding oxidoreductase [Crocinitomicaceae bacterium]|nr:FAD-binding oxidoreductase [Crocinitomicaceae bacterium]